MHITKHAFERMQERGISEVHIMQVLDDKAILEPSKSQEDVSIVHGTVNGLFPHLQVQELHNG
ncbi:MAG: DUF4258 domain-containing protein [Candidatus Fibromonas sp.]|nr:DUF4258 domain-containing protein [Candidatus Fibromonas sp.]